MVNTIFKIIAGVAAVLIVVSVIVTVNSVKKLKSRVETQGVIVAIEEDTAEIVLGDGEHKALSPVVEYEANGRRYTFKGKYYSTSMRVGDKVTVVYSADAPEEASVKTGLYFAPVILWALSLLFVIAAAVYYILKSKGIVH